MCVPGGVLRLPDVELEVVECGDASDGVIDRIASAPALAKDLVVLACEAEVVRAASRRRPGERVQGIRGLPQLRHHADIVILALPQSRPPSAC
jgi:hypothetical protein